MSAYVIAKKDCEFLDTPVFYSGEQGEEEGVAVFTGRGEAAKYIDRAGWTDHEVGELQSIQLLRWLVTAHEQGIDMVIINPHRDHHQVGGPQTVVYLGEPLSSFAELLGSELIKSAEEASA